MMEELLLIALGMYLLRKGGTPDYRSVPNGRELHSSVLNAYGQPDVPPQPDHLICPWFWKKRPAIFNVVPINPKSRDNWLTLCDYWREIRLLGMKIPLNTVKANEEQDSNIKAELEAQLVADKNRQSFLLNEVKRIADVQKRTEALYLKSLENNFSDNEIKDFYLTRKNEILQGIWPKTDTQVVPIISPGPGGRDRKAVDLGPVDRGGAVQMANKYDRAQMNKKPELYKRPWWEADKKRIAAPPGKRISSTGNVYYEYRINRSDEPGRNI